MRALALVAVSVFTVVLGSAGCVLPTGAPCCTDDLACVDGARCFEGRCALRCDDVAQCDEGETCLDVGVCRSARLEDGCTFSAEASAAQATERAAR